MTNTRSLEQVVDSLQTASKREVAFLVTIFSAIFFVLDVVLVRQMVYGTISVAQALLVHSGLVAALGLLTALMAYFSCDSRLFLCLVIFGFCLGPIGGFICFFIGLLYQLYRKLTTPFGGLLEQLFPEPLQIPRLAELSQRMERGLENVDVDTTAIPFMDIMSFGALQQRIRAVSLTLRYFHPRLAPVLFKGLHDPNNSVRVLSATSILALDKHYYDTYLDLQKEVTRNPKSRLAWLSLARHAETYTSTKILSPERAKKILMVARKAYETVADLSGNRDDIYLGMARVDLEFGNLENAQRILKQLCETANPDMQAYKLLWEVEFALGNFSTLRTLAEKSPQLFGSELDREILENLATFWRRRDTQYA